MSPDNSQTDLTDVSHFHDCCWVALDLVDEIQGSARASRRVYHSRESNYFGFGFWYAIFLISIDIPVTLFIFYMSAVTDILFWLLCATLLCVYLTSIPCLTVKLFLAMRSS